MIGYLHQSRRPRKAARRWSFLPRLDVLEDRVQPSAIVVHEPLMPIDPIPPVGGAGVISVSTQVLDLTRGGPSESFTIVLNRQPTAEVDVTLAVYDPNAGSDGTTVSLNQLHLVFTTADWSTPQTVNATAAAGSTPRADASLNIFGTTTSADATFDAQAVPPIRVYVTDPVTTPPGIVLSNDSLNVTRGGSGDSFTVALATAPTDTVTLTITQSGGDALPISPTTLTFTTTDWNTPQSVTVGPPTSGAGDQFDTLTLTDTSNDPNYDNGELPSVYVNVIDPAAALAGLVFSTNSLTVTAGGPSATYTIALASQPNADVTVDINQFGGPFPIGMLLAVRPAGFWPSPGVTLNVAPRTLTFTPEDWNTPQTITVAAPNGPVAPSGSVVYLSETVTSADPNYDGLAAPDVAVTVQPNPAAAQYSLVFSKQALTVAPGRAGDSYTIALASQPTADVTVTISQEQFPMAMPMWRTVAGGPAMPAYYGNTLTITPTTLTFTPDDWNTPQTVTVALPAGAASGSMLFSVTDNLVHTVTSSDPNYNNIWTPPLPVYINYPTLPPPLLTPITVPPVLVHPPIKGHQPVTPPHTPITVKPKPPAHHSTNGSATKHPAHPGTTTAKHVTHTVIKPATKPAIRQVLHTPAITGWTMHIAR